MGIEEKLTPITEDEFFNILEEQLQFLTEKTNELKLQECDMLNMYNKVIKLKNTYHMKYYLNNESQILYEQGDKKVIGFKRDRKK